MKIVALFYRILVATTIVGVLLALAAANTTAQTNDYLVTIKGTERQDGGKSKLTLASVKNTTQFVVLRIIKNPPRQIQLQRRDATTNTVLSIFVSSFRQAFLVDGSFSSDLELNDPSSELDGDLQITGKETPATNPTKVKATLIGVLNDGLNSQFTDFDLLYKATVTGARIPLVP